MKKFYFSMIIYVDDDEQLNNSIKSVFSVSKEIQQLVKLIIVDPICSEVSTEISKKWEEKIGKDSVCYIPTLDMPIAEAYNVAIPEIKGTYVNFSLASTWFDAGALECVKHVAELRERPKLISLSPWTVNEKAEFLHYKVSPEPSNELYENIRFYNQPQKLQLMFHAYFIRTFLIKSQNYDRKFRPELYGDTVMEMLMELLAEWRGYVFIPKFKFHYTLQLEDNTSAFLGQHYEWWYNDSFKNWILPFAEKWSAKNWPLEPSMRIALLYLVFARYNCNYNDRNKGVLDKERLDEFVSLTGKVLQYIDNDTIFLKKGKFEYQIPRSLRMLLLRIKAQEANSTAEVSVFDEKFYLWMHRNDINTTEQTLSAVDSSYYPKKELFEEQKKELAHNLSMFTVEREKRNVPEIKMAYENNSLVNLAKTETEQVIFKVINYKDGMLEIDGTFSAGDLLDNEQIKLKAIKDEVVIPIEFSEVYGLDRVFGVTYNRKYQFHASIPGTSIFGNSEVRFYMELNGEDVLLKIRTDSVHAHVRHDVKGQYWAYDDDWSLNIANNTVLRIIRLTDSLRKKKEKTFRTELMSRAKKGDTYAAKALELRKRYFEEKEKMFNQRIWITFDKLYKAGDNGEYMYDYIETQNDGIDIRYLIKEDSPDYERMLNKGDKLLVWGKDETLLTVLLAEAILTTHTNIISYTGFDKEMIPYICDLFNSTNICIQHGLTTQNIAQFQNRLFDNLQLYLCASPNEIENLSRPIYGYTDKTALKLTGVARYDGLKSNDQKQILITPTWRRNIANANVAHVKKGHNEYFKNSEYYRIYNSLINDEKLIECAKKTGYKIIYLLHPAASAQVDDFDRNDYVELIPAASDMNYEKILTESSLMVTDYSGVQFDFAYQRKPLVYYHPKTLPPHYDESKAYVYERDAFGPLVDNHDDMITTLCEYMENECKMLPEYVERADKFFAYNDFESRERIYNAILTFLNERKKDK